MSDLTTDVIAYEDGDLGEDETVAMFQGLIDSGQAWRLQGSYGRTAMAMIEDGVCTLGPTGHRDYYGNYVPGRDEVEPGTKGSPEYVAERADR
jgi:hypothetical protein